MNQAEHRLPSLSSAVGRLGSQNPKAIPHSLEELVKTGKDAHVFQPSGHGHH